MTGTKGAAKIIPCFKFPLISKSLVIPLGVPGDPKMISRARSPMSP